jgi:hypothetical protein
MVDSKWHAINYAEPTHRTLCPKSLRCRGKAGRSRARCARCPRRTLGVVETGAEIASVHYVHWCERSSTLTPAHVQLARFARDLHTQRVHDYWHARRSDSPLTTLALRGVEMLVGAVALDGKADAVLVAVRVADAHWVCRADRQAMHRSCVRGCCAHGVDAQVRVVTGHWTAQSVVSLAGVMYNQ